MTFELSDQERLSRRATVALIAGTAAGLSFGQSPGSADIKKALCIGNARYPSRPLKNPANDARSVSAALRDLGFDVTTLLDASLEQMRSGFRTFFEAVKDAQTAFIFYAGHGFEVNGTNYLIPADINPGVLTSGDISQFAVSLKSLTAEFERSRAKVRVVVVDACRDTPKRGEAPSMAQMSPKGTLLAFSTSPGSLAEDSMGGTRASNSPYTFALVESLRNQSLTVKEMFNRAHNTVAALTQDRQIPWVHDGMTGDLRFIDSKAVISSGVLSPILGIRNSSGVNRGVSTEDTDVGRSTENADKRSLAREKLVDIYGSDDPEMATGAIKSLNFPHLQAFVDAGIIFSIIDKRKKINTLIDFIVNKHPDFPKLISILRKGNINLNEGVRLRNSGDLPEIPDRLYFLVKTKHPDLYAISPKAALLTIRMQALPFAIWFKNKPAIKALLQAGISLETPLLIYVSDIHDSSGLIEVTTYKNELITHGYRDLT